MVLAAAQGVAQARETLRAALAATSHSDPDFGRTLRAVHDMRIVTARELAEWVGLSRSRFYDFIREAEA